MDVLKVRTMRSSEYRKTGFDLMLVASDNVARSYVNLMKYTYDAENDPDREPSKMMGLFAQLLLEIRKSVGNEKTKLEKKEMLQWLIKDSDKLQI